MEQPHLPGHALTPQAAIGDSQEIAVGLFVASGPADAGAPGQTYFSRASIVVIRWLKRQHDTPPHETIHFAYTQQRIPADIAEVSLEPHKMYIFFFKVNKEQERRALKIALADEDTIHRLEDMLRQGH